MRPEDRIPYVQILAQMLIADGVLADEERAHLDKIMDGLELTAEERKRALSGVSIDSPVEERIAELSEGARSGLLQEVEKALNVDGKLTASEAHFLERVQNKLG